MHYRSTICLGCLIAWGVLFAEPAQLKASCGDYLAGDEADEQFHMESPLQEEAPCHGPSCRSNDGNFPAPSAPDRLARMNVEQWAIAASAVCSKTRTSGWLSFQSRLVLPEGAPEAVERPPRILG